MLSPHKRLTALFASLLTATGGLLISATQQADAAPFAVSIKQPTSAVAALASSYAVPSGAIFVSPNGSNGAAGTATAPYKTLGYALTKVKAHGTVVVRGGTYREGATGYNTGGTNYVVNLNGVTIQSYPGETVWLDGTEVVSSWTKVSATDYKASWSTPTFCAGSYYTRNFASQSPTGPCSYGDAIGGGSSLGDPQMVFVNGREIEEVGSRSALTTNTFFYDWSAKVMHLGFDPAGKTIEVTKQPQALALFKPTNVSIKGIGFRRYASNQYGNATSGALLLNSGSNVLLENVALTQNAGNGILVWNANKLTIRGSWVSENGANGMNFAGSAQKLATDPSVRDDLTIEYSRFDRNNTDNFSRSCTYSCNASGVKMAGLVGGNIRYSTFNYNGGGRASGVWCDLDCTGVNVYGNKVVGNARHGVVYEVSNKGVIASNQIADNGWGSTINGGGYGLMMGSANTRIYNNTFNNNRQSVYLYDDDRSPSSSTGYDSSRVGPDTTNVAFVNNIVAAPSTATAVLLRVSGGKTGVGGNTSAAKVVGTLNYNSYAKSSSVQFMNWRANSDKAGSVYNTIPALRSAQGAALEPNGSLLADGSALLVSPFTGDYTVKADHSRDNSSTALPSDIAGLLGVSATGSRDRGVIHLGA